MSTWMFIGRIDRDMDYGIKYLSLVCCWNPAVMYIDLVLLSMPVKWYLLHFERSDSMKIVILASAYHISTFEIDLISWCINIHIHVNDFITALQQNTNIYLFNSNVCKIIHLHLHMIWLCSSTKWGKNKIGIQCLPAREWELWNRISLPQ